MIIVTFNIRGLGVPHKKYVLDRLDKVHKLDIIIILEMMMKGKEANIIFSYILKAWIFVYM